MRLIDADEFKKQFFELETEFRPSQIDAVFDCLYNSELFDAVNAVEVVHGEWVHEFGGYVNCSECGASPLLDGEREYVETNYCPNCGAKMDKGEADT